MISEDRRTRAIVRPYRATDRAGVYDVCIRTADAGADATGRYRDPDVVPDVFAGPYVELEPGFAFVVDDGDRVVGYVLGAPDTARFVEAFRRDWLPVAGARHPEPAGEPATDDERMASLLHHPERMLRPELAAYPAHLHIDLLPSHQRAGHGRELMDALFGALRAAGVGAVHLAVSTRNTNARAFYGRLGFHEITVAGPEPYVAYLGRSTEPVSGPASPRTA